MAEDAFSWREGVKGKYLLVLCVLSDTMLMGYRGDLCVLPAQTVHVFPAVIY